MQLDPLEYTRLLIARLEAIGVPDGDEIPEGTPLGSLLTELDVFLAEWVPMAKNALKFEQVMALQPTK